MKKEDRYRLGTGLYEFGLDRIWKHINRGFVILSSNQNRDNETEEKAFRELNWKVHRAGAGYIELDGVWYDDEKGIEYHEKSLVVPYPGDEKWKTKDEFNKEMLNIAQSFEQEAIIVGDGEDGNVKIVYLDGRVDDLGKFLPDKLAQAYSKISKGRHVGRTFTFKGVRVPGSAMEALAMRKMGYIFEGKIWFVVR